MLGAVRAAGKLAGWAPASTLKGPVRRGESRTAREAACGPCREAPRPPRRTARSAGEHRAPPCAGPAAPVALPALLLLCSPLGGRRPHRSRPGPPDRGRGGRGDGDAGPGRRRRACCLTPGRTPSRLRRRHEVGPAVASLAGKGSATLQDTGDDAISALGLAGGVATIWGAEAERRAEGPRGGRPRRRSRSARRGP